MKEATWLALREYIALEVQIARMEDRFRKGADTREILERLRLKQSEFETAIREACDP